MLNQQDPWGISQNKGARRPRTFSLSEEEHTAIYVLLPTKGVIRFVTERPGSAQYLKQRIRKTLMKLNLNEMVATSLQGHELYVWRISKYNTWRLTRPLTKCKVWVDAQDKSCTLYWGTKRNPKPDEEVLSYMKERLGASAQTQQTKRINIEPMLAVLETNLKDGRISKQEYEESKKALLREGGADPKTKEESR